jgi:glycine oxidase
MPAKGAQVDTDVIVVGGGVIGTAAAWRAARLGRTVTLIDPGDRDPVTGDQASLVAAGMLGPVSESVFGERDLLNLNLHAVRRFPAFNAELEQAAGQSTGLRTEGTLSVAYDSDDLAALDRLTDFRHSLGLKAERLNARECRKLEPFLTPGVTGGVLAAGDLSVDNRRYLAALRVAARAAGVRFVRGSVDSVDRVPGHAAGIRVRAGGGPNPTAHGVESHRDQYAGQVVIAAGHGTSRINGLPDQVRRAIRPVKGQVLRLRHPKGLPPILTRTVRAVVQGRDIYLVPRENGELVVGATQEERGDRNVTAGAVHDLLRDAITAAPAVSELIFAEASAGLRPGTSDNGPIVGVISENGSAECEFPPTGHPRNGLVIAAGHFRNGILLSAVTADAVTALLGDRPPDEVWKPFSPRRFM